MISLSRFHSIACYSEYGEIEACMVPAVEVVVSVVTREGEVVVVCRTFLKGGKPLFL